MSTSRIATLFAISSAALFITVWAGSTAHTQAPAPNVVTGQGFPNPNPTVTRNWGQLPAGTEGAYQLLANLISFGNASR